MPRYWVIAPFEAGNLETFDKVWKFDLANGVISIGWNEIGDPSKISLERLAEIVNKTYSTLPQQTKTLFCNMLWKFYHEITPGDLIVARRGRKVLAAVGTVTSQAVYAPGKNPEIPHPNFLGVAWQEKPREKTFNTLVFPMHTLNELPETEYFTLVEQDLSNNILEPLQSDNQVEFVFEKYLEDVIVTNFTTIFKGKLQMYEVAGEKAQQYTTDVGIVDILGIEPETNSFVVIELKKGRSSDQVVGQILRYMGWVKKNLCKNNQGVKGLIICKEPDQKLSYALEMTCNISVKYYTASFALRDSA